VLSLTTPTLLQELINLNAEEAQIYGASQGVLMPDVTLLPPPSASLPPPSSSSPEQQQLPSTICIEIKPKYGSLTNCNTTPPEDVDLKHSTSRYQLHQLLKKDQGTITSVSSYDPLDLFSGVADRMEDALHSLLENPQNNLRIFINGKPVEIMNSATWESVDSTGGQSEGCSLDKAITTAAAALLPLENQSNTASTTAMKKSLVRLLRLILQQDPVLHNISRAQQACRFDIAGIYRLYHRMLKMKAREEKHEEIDEKVLVDESPPRAASIDPADWRWNTSKLGTTDFPGNDDGEDLTARGHRDAIADVIGLSWKESIQTMRSYVIATTAKDCSIMITMRSNGHTDALNKNNSSSKEESFSAKLQTEKENGVVVFSETEKIEGLHSVEYRISVVDLDRKSTSKIPKHYELDQQIIKAAKKLRRKQN